MPRRSSMFRYPIKVVWMLTGLAGCWSGIPDDKHPWTVVLSEAATDAWASKTAHRLAGKHPELDGVFALSVRSEEGLVRHLVVSRGQVGAEAAQELRKRLLGQRVARYPVVNTTGLARIDDSEVSRPLPPEGAEPLEELLTWLPDPGSDQLTSFWLATRMDVPAWLPRRSYGRAGPTAWSRVFARLGFEALAEGRYAGPANGQVRVWVGRVPANPQVLDQAVIGLREFLGQHAKPTEEEIARRKEEHKARRKTRRTRKARGRGKKRADAKLKPEASELTDQTTEKKAEAVVTQSVLLPSGPAKAQVVERVTLLQQRNIKPDTPIYTAWLIPNAERHLVTLVLFDDPALAERVLTPSGLEEHGLSFAPDVARIWRYVPDVTVPGEQLSCMGSQRLFDWLPPRFRRAEWARRLASSRILTAGYSADKGLSGWQMSWAGFQSPDDAQRVFDQVLVAPRQEQLQRVLQSKKQVGYNIGIVLQEVGDVQGWYLNGAAKGRIQEIYFNRNNMIWLVAAPVAARGGPESDQMLARLEMLPLWDLDKPGR